MCLYPKIGVNKKYIMNKKNGGVIPPIFDERVLAVPIGCGRCIECRKQESRKWQVRLLEDIRHNKNGKFVTLTFSDKELIKIKNEIKGLEGYELDNEIATIAVKRWRERWRKKYGKSIRHWLITELGHEGTENIHMHGIVWTDEPLEEVEKHWRYGIMWKGKDTGKGKLENYVNERTTNYITKYITKIDEKHKYYKSKVLTSPGIGSGYIGRGDARRNRYKEGETNEAYKTRSGHEIALPVYWRNKIYTEEEREKLWIEKLDKKERWICGEKVDISKGEEGYYKLLKYHRNKNKRLGYGDDEINWSRKQYENERRKTMILERERRTNESLEQATAKKKGGSSLSTTEERKKKPNTQGCRLASPEEGAGEGRILGKGMQPSKDWE